MLPGKNHHNRLSQTITHILINIHTNNIIMVGNTIIFMGFLTATGKHNKFNQRKIYSDLFDGEIRNPESKTLDSISKIVDDSRIRGSDSWKDSRRFSIHSKFNQFGNSLISLLQLQFWHPKYALKSVLNDLKSSHF